MINEKLEIAKKLLKEKDESLIQDQEFLDEAEKKFIGKALDNELKRWGEDYDEVEVEIEALKMFIQEEEMREKQAEDHEAEERETERIAENAQEHAEEMLAEEQQIKAEEREASDNNLEPQ